MVCADRRTLPSRTEATFSLCATVPMSGCAPWNENDEVRAATCSSLIWDREFSSSSVSPSEKYSWLGSPLMFTNGSTAIECGGGVNATGVSADAGCLAGSVGFAIQGFPTRRYAAPAASTARSAGQRHPREGRPETTACGWAVINE